MKTKILLSIFLILASVHGIQAAPSPAGEILQFRPVADEVGSSVTAVFVLRPVLSLMADDGEAQRRLEEATVSFVRPGMPSSERDFNLRGGKSMIVRSGDDSGRRAVDWFSFDLPVDDSPTLELIVTYGSKESANRVFAVLVDGKKIAEEKITGSVLPERNGPTYVLYRLAERLVVGKKKVTIRFEALEGSETGTVCGIRVVRAPEHLE